MSQEKYIEKVFQRFNMKDAKLVSVSTWKPFQVQEGGLE